VHAKLQLMPMHWYGWQMLPGYFGVPYFSPIWVQEVTPRKTGKGILAVKFINTLYAEGVQNSNVNLRILKHEASYLAAEILYGADGPGDRTAIVSSIDFEWIRLFCPGVWAEHPPESFRGTEREDVSRYLSAVFPGALVN
jgi:hypothetical protein